MKKIIIILNLIVLMVVTSVVVSASSTPNTYSAPSNAPDDCDLTNRPLNYEEYTDSVLVYRTQICPAVGSLIVTFTEWVGTDPPTSRSATVRENNAWQAHVEVVEIINAETNLASNIDGAKWVPKLREWEMNAQNYYTQWNTLTDTQKDGVMQEMLRRQGLTWGGLADLLIILDKGR